VVGPHALAVRGRVCAHGAVARHLSRHRHQPRGVRHQSARRRAARHPRSEAAQLMADELLEPQTRPQAGEQRPALAVDGLKTYFFTRLGILKAVDDVSFALAQRETLAIVGESGCGKSMTALSLMRLVPDPPGRIVGGSVVLDGRDLLKLDEAQMRAVRGN